MSVRPRSPEEQARHDRALQDIARAYLRYERIVLTNPDGQRNVAVGRMYPDLVIKERVPPAEARREPRVLLIGEVETPSSVNEEEVAQWRAYSRLGLPFVLFVPHASLEAARRLLEQGQVQVTELVGYRYVDGRIALTRLEGAGGEGRGAVGTAVA